MAEKVKKGVVALNQDEKIESLEKKIDGNYEDLSNKIDENGRNIARNAEKIDRNAEKIDRNAEKIDHLDTRLEEAVRRLDHLRGSDLEKSMPKRIGSHLNTKMGLRNQTILLSALHDMDKELTQTLYRALDDGLLTHEEYSRIFDTDLIVRAFTPDGGEVWLALEISSTINDDDIERALKSADIIQRVLEKQSVAAVAGYTMPAPQAEKAVEMNVEVLVFSERL